jgi:FixJ family two-component response regulator
LSDSVGVVHLVDDDSSLRTAVSRLLRAGGYEVQAYASVGEFLMRERVEGPACIVLDVRMPGPSGLDLQQALDAREDALPIVFLTGHGDIPMSVRAMRAGAVDFLTKPVKRDVLLNAVRAAFAQREQRRAGLERSQHVRGRFERLTSREREVFGRVVAGMLNKQIADELGCSIRTVKIHRARTMEKMQVDSLADLVRAAEMLRTPDAKTRPESAARS